MYISSGKINYFFEKKSNLEGILNSVKIIEKQFNTGIIFFW
jgi:hypothetical protein